VHDLLAPHFIVTSLGLEIPGHFELARKAQIKSGKRRKTEENGISEPRKPFYASVIRDGS
jgi:hypothetical protein